MTKEIRAIKTFGDYANIEQLDLKRDWMENTGERHAYHCFPVSLANRLGWAISLPDDVSFIWDGSNDPASYHVKITKGHRFANVNRANHTISFETGIRFESEENVTLLTMPVPNEFVRGAQCFTTLLSTSVMKGTLPIAWMITEPNLEISIPAGTPIAAVFPISLTDVQDYELKVSKYKYDREYEAYMKDRGDAAEKKNSIGDWSHFYRDAVDHLGNKMGKHESKKIIMKVTEEK